MLALTAVLTSCGAAPAVSRLDAYEARAEELTDALLGELAGGRAPVLRTVSRASIDDSQWLVPRERQAAHWTTTSTLEFVDVEASAVAGALRARLTEERWRVEPTVDQGGVLPSVDTYRRDASEGAGDWIVQVAWNDAHRLSVIVQSPVTVRGDEG